MSNEQHTIRNHLAWRHSDFGNWPFDSPPGTPYLEEPPRPGQVFKLKHMALLATLKRNITRCLMFGALSMDTLPLTPFQLEKYRRYSTHDYETQIALTNKLKEDASNQYDKFIDQYYEIDIYVEQGATRQNLERTRRSRLRFIFDDKFGLCPPNLGELIYQIYTRNAQIYHPGLHPIYRAFFLLRSCIHGLRGFPMFPPSNLLLNSLDIGDIITFLKPTLLYQP